MLWSVDVSIFYLKTRSNLNEDEINISGEMAQPSARPLTAAHGWKHLVHMIPIQCVPDELGRISLVEMTSMYMDITMTAAGKLRDNFLSWHPAVAKGHSQIAPSDIVMTPKRVGCFLAYVDPSLRSVAPPDWAIWGEPRADYNSARPPTKRTQDADIGERPKKKVRFNLPENPLAEFKAVTAPDKQKTSMDWERSRVAINGMTFLFSTGQTDAVRHPGLELCAVSHKFGKFRLVWGLAPKCRILPEKLRASAYRIKWVDAGVDPETGLQQVQPIDRSSEWEREDKAYIGFLTRQYHFDAKGFIGKDKKRNWSDEYENLLW